MQLKNKDIYLHCQTTQTRKNMKSYKKFVADAVSAVNAINDTFRMNDNWKLSIDELIISSVRSVKILVPMMITDAEFGFIMKLGKNKHYNISAVGTVGTERNTIEIVIYFDDIIINA